MCKQPRAATVNQLGGLTGKTKSIMWSTVTLPSFTQDEQKDSSETRWGFWTTWKKATKRWPTFFLLICRMLKGSGDDEQEAEGMLTPAPPEHRGACFNIHDITSSTGREQWAATIPLSSLFLPLPVQMKTKLLAPPFFIILSAFKSKQNVTGYKEIISHDALHLFPGKLWIVYMSVTDLFFFKPPFLMPRFL